MSFNSKQKPTEQIDATDKQDTLDDLSPEDKEELLSMLNEPFGHETESLEDFKKALSRWCAK